MTNSQEVVESPTGRPPRIEDVILVIGVTIAAGVSAVGGVIIAFVAWKFLRKTPGQVALLLTIGIAVPVVELIGAGAFSLLMNAQHTIR